MSTERAFRMLGPAILCAAGVLLAGCGRKAPTFKPVGTPKVALSLRLAKTDSFPEAEEVRLTKDQEFFDPDAKKTVTTLFVAKDVAFTNAAVAGTSASRNPFDPERWQIEVFLTREGADTFARFTRENLGSQLAIFFDDRFETAPKIMSVISEGRVVIEGQFTEAEATRLAKSIVGQ